eukprot:13879782-Alexandrium_andersonii.AAC.1
MAGIQVSAVLALTFGRVHLIRDPEAALAMNGHEGPHVRRAVGEPEVRPSAGAELGNGNSRG